MQNLAIGILAHVDAGKTTLSEALLFESGCLKKLGRVDRRDSFLDTYEMERKRGITVFSKQALIPLDAGTITLIDTPGHVDFSSEAERTLSILDYAILVINASDGIQGHTLTLWQLLARYDIPVFLFINKMDLPNTDAAVLTADLKSRLHEGCISFSDRTDEQSLQEEIAVCDETVLERFLDGEKIDNATIANLVCRRKIFPCYFGSALKSEGVAAFLDGIKRYTAFPDYPLAFGAKVYKITRDPQGNRLTHLKVTGGRLAVKDSLSDARSETPSVFTWKEKVNHIRLYSGEKYQTVEEAAAGAVCAVTGLTQTYPGLGLGVEPSSPPPALEPILSFRVRLPDGYDPHTALQHLRQLEEEDPLLSLSYTEQTKEIRLHLMGEVQMEILSHIARERFGLELDFDASSVLYRETIAAPVIGMGHFEPLRHYAEVHLLMEPGPRGSGLQFDTICDDNMLPINWQRTILSHLQEKEHSGVLTGSPLTDMKITLVAGRAHLKHTEGGDFRRAVYRALRQGLMQAQSVLLEPWYRFELELPTTDVGRAMTDLQRTSGEVTLSAGSDSERARLTGSAPASFLRDYTSEITSYTRGLGQLSFSFKEFAPCPNAEAVIAEIGYDPERDLDNPADSVFCLRGAGVNVKWDEVKEYMHVNSDAFLTGASAKTPIQESPQICKRELSSATLDRELEAIYEKTYGPIKRRDFFQRQERNRRDADATPPQRTHAPVFEKPDYLLIDGYNVIHAWDDLKALSQDNMDAARTMLLDILSNYRGFRDDQEIIVVFDAYKVPRGMRSIDKYLNIHVVYTKEAETADTYIEKVTYQIGRKHRVTVASADGAVQMIIGGHGALRITPGALCAQIEQTDADIAAIIRTYARRAKFSHSITFPK